MGCAKAAKLLTTPRKSQAAWYDTRSSLVRWGKRGEAGHGMSDQQQSPHQVDSATALKVRKQPQPGDVLDGTYRLDQQLGKGGVGVVYRAFHLHLQRPCAIKFMHPQLVSNPELRTRFRREAQSAFQLGHPNIVAITDFRDDPNAWPYLAMELVIGETLRDRLERGPLSPRLSLRLMIELCDALSAAHRRGVIHRDLKPENLFLVRVDSPGPDELDTTLKVLDFGLSKLLDGVEITGTGRLLGSPSYMSPEQARGDSHLVDARSDIFAVGVLLYECLIGEKMFNAERLEQKRQQIMAAKLPPLTFGERGLPLVDAIITRACSRRPEDRYQTAAALKDALEEAERTLLRQATQVAAQLLVPTIAPALGLAPSSVSQSSGQRPPPLPAALIGDRTSNASSVGGGELVLDKPATPPRRRSGVAVALAAGAVALSIVGGIGYAVLQRRSASPVVGTSEPAPGDTTSTPVHSVGTGGSTVGTGSQIAGPQPVVVSPVVASPASTQGTGSSAPVEAPSVTKARPVGADKLPPIRGADEPGEDPAPLVAAVAVGTGSKPAGLVPRGKKGRGGLRPIATAPVPVAAASPGKSGAGLNDSALNVNGVMRRALPAVLRCYPADASPPPKISVDLTVQADGRVSEANIDGAEDGAACVLGVIRGLRLPPPTDGDSYGFRYDFVNLRR